LPHGNRTTPVRLNAGQLSLADGEPRATEPLEIRSEVYALLCVLFGLSINLA
jgi:hypothetical protein